MSGTYDVVFDKNPKAPVIMSLLARANDNRLATARFRDCWLERQGELYEVHVYMRIGGRNRDEYQTVIDQLREHPWYDRDADDSFDSTYCGFWFRVDVEQYARMLTEIAESFGEELGAEVIHSAIPKVVIDTLDALAQEPVDTDALWKERIAQLESGDVDMDEIVRRLGEHVEVVVMNPEDLA